MDAAKEHIVQFQGNTSLDTDDANLFQSFVIYRVALKIVLISEFLIDAFREILVWTRMRRKLFYSFAFYRVASKFLPTNEVLIDTGL